LIISIFEEKSKYRVQYHVTFFNTWCGTLFFNVATFMYKHEGISKVGLKTIGLENFGEFALQVHEHTQRGVPLRNKEIA